MDKLKCPKCNKLYRKLHKVNKRGLKYYLCYKCYKHDSIKDRSNLMRYHDNNLFVSMMDYFNKLEQVKK